MAAGAQRLKALRGAAERYAIRAEVVACQRILRAAVHAARNVAPCTRLGEPAGAGLGDRIHAIFTRAAQRLEAHILAPLRRAHQHHIPHDAIGSDAERCSVDVILHVGRREQVEGDEVAPLRVRGQSRQFFMTRELLAVLAFPVAGDGWSAAARHCERWRKHDQQLQARSAARAARTSGASCTLARYSGCSTPTTTPAPARRRWRICSESSKRRKCTDEVFSSFSRSRSSSAMACTRSQPCTSTQVLRSMPLSRASMRCRSPASGYSMSMVAFQLPPSGTSGL